MRTESQIIADIARIEKDVKVGREILCEWKRSELYPGQFTKQAMFVELATQCGLLPLAKVGDL